jgi:hypothetical protein
MLETILSLVVAAFVGALGKDLYDRSSASRCSRRFRVAFNVRNNRSKLIELNEYPVIQLHPIERHINAALRESEGGVWIFGAPEGSGKSTYLDRCIELFRQEPQTRHVCVYQGVNYLRDRNIHLALGVPLIESISDYIPRGTVIVIDQVDCKVETIDNNVAEYIVELATNSRNSKCYSVVICVSNPDVMLRMLKLNNMEKIKDICHPKFLQWTARETRQYIDEVFLQWSNSDKEKLANACQNSNSPGVLHSAHKTWEGGDYTVAEIIDLATNWDHQKHKRWEAYDDVLAGHPFFRPFKDNNP